MRVTVLAVCGTLACLTAGAHGSLVHRYSFNDGTARDSVGGANGTVVDPKGTYARFDNGRLDLTENNFALSSHQDFSIPSASGAYVDLPNGIVSSLGNRASFETWVNVQNNAMWAEIFSFGTSQGGENSSVGAPDTRYITLIPQGPAVLRLTHRQYPFGGAAGPVESFVDAAGALSAGVWHHVVAVWDETDTAGGANPNGTQTLYLDGARVGSSRILPNISLATLTDNNNWLGRSQFPDPLLDASLDEFRIYDNALTAADVAASFAAGPNTLVPEPSAAALAAAGLFLVTLCRTRR